MASCLILTRELTIDDRKSATVTIYDQLRERGGEQVVRHVIPQPCSEIRDATSVPRHILALDMDEHVTNLSYLACVLR